MSNNLLNINQNSKLSQCIQVLFALLLLSLASYLLLFCLYTTSDVFLEEIWARALYSRGPSAWFDLLFSFSPAYFPDFTGYMLAKLGHFSPVITVYFATLFQIAMFFFSVVLLLRVLGKKQMVYTAMLLLLLTGAIALSIKYPGMWLWYYSTNDNLSATILGFFALYLTLLYLEAASCAVGLILAILVGFGVLNGRLFILTFIAPALVTGLIFILPELIKSRFRHLTKILCDFHISKLWFFIFIGLVLGVYVFEPLINPYSTVSTKLNSGITFFESCKEFFIVLQDAFLLHEPFLTSTIIFFIILLIISLLILRQKILNIDSIIQLCSIKFWLTSTKETKFFKCSAKDFFYMFCLIAIVGNFIGPIVAGQIKNNLATFRYFTTLISLPFIILMVTSSAKESSSAYRLNWCLIFGLLFFLLVNSFYEKPLLSSKQFFNYVPNTIEKQIADCVDDYAEKYHLHYGVSDYWNSYSISLLSNQNIWINPVCSNMEPCVALDRHIYFNPPESKKGQSNLYNFVLVSDNGQFSFSENNVQKNIPKPDHVLNCPYNYKVYVFDKEIARFNKVLKHSFMNLEFQYGHGSLLNIMSTEWMQLGGNWGYVKSPDITLKTPVGWAYGAFRHSLSKGSYRVVIALRVESAKESGLPVLAAGFGDIVYPFNPAINDLSNQGDFFSGNKNIQYFERKFNVTWKNKDTVWGFWLFNYGRGTAKIEKAFIERLPEKNGQ